MIILQRTVDWSESKSGEIKPKGVASRITGLAGHPIHITASITEDESRGHRRSIKTAGFSQRCNLPSAVAFPIFPLNPEMWP